MYTAMTLDQTIPVYISFIVTRKSSKDTIIHFTMGNGRLRIRQKAVSFLTLDILIVNTIMELTK